MDTMTVTAWCESLDFASQFSVRGMVKAYVRFYQMTDEEAWEKVMQEWHTLAKFGNEKGETR